MVRHFILRSGLLEITQMAQGDRCFSISYIPEWAVRGIRQDAGILGDAASSDFPQPE